MVDLIAILLILGHLMRLSLNGSTVRTCTFVGCSSTRPLPVVGDGLCPAADGAGFCVGAAGAATVIPPSAEAVSVRIFQTADRTGPGVGVAVIVLPVETVRTAVYRTAGRAGADMAAVFIAPLAVGMVFSSLFQAALAGNLMGAVPQVLALRKAMGRGGKIRLAAIAGFPMVCLIFLPVHRGVIAGINLNSAFPSMLALHSGNQ